MEFNNDIKYYNVDKEEVTKDLSVNPEKGLSESEVKTRREKYGLNEFTPKEEGSFWDDLKESLSEPNDSYLDYCSSSKCSNWGNS